MTLQIIRSVDQNRFINKQGKTESADLPNLNKAEELTEKNRKEVIEFLSVRPVHTVVMISFINDNGLQSVQNRGKFYGYRNNLGQIEGVALIGHTTLIEARTDDALTAFALKARVSETPLKLILSDGNTAKRFWEFYAIEGQKPMHNFTELLFELYFPFLIQDCPWNVRLAKPEEFVQVAEAQAEVAFIESGINPLEKDREGFLKRCLRRIEQGRTFVVFENGKLIFKIDIVAETEDTAYLEGFYVAPEMRGKGIGSKCLSKTALILLEKYRYICGLSNIEFKGVHKSLAKAGFRNTDSCRTIFV